MEIEEAKVAFEQGSLIAVVDALILCADSAEQIPVWVAENYKDALAVLIGLRPSGKKGQAAQPASVFRRNLRQFHRWDAVKRASAAGKKNDERFHHAVKLLEGTLSAGKFSSVRRDYRIVNKAKKAGLMGPYRAPRSSFVGELVWRRLHQQYDWPQAPSEQLTGDDHQAAADSTVT